jgi:hypothetical protein
LTQFAQDNFGAAQLGDRRRTRSLVDLAERIARHPEGSLPQKFGDPNALRRCYDLMNTPAVTHAAVLTPHRDHTFAQLIDYDGVVLFVHDTTELNFTSHTKLHEELGPIGQEHGRGYQCHNSLAVAVQDRRVFGLVNQQLHVRAEVPANESVAQKRERESRESLLWVHGVAPLPAAPPGRLWVDVCDRGGETFELMDYEEVHQRRFVVRAWHKRRIRVGHAADGARTSLHPHLRSLPGQEQRAVEIHDHDTGAVRTAQLTIAWAAVRLLLPKHRRGHYRGVPLDVWAVRVWEENPPEGVEAVEWFLLTNVPVSTVEQAWERVDWYCLRWIVEEYHKAQKTGCMLESPQFETAAALQPMVALLSVVAVLLLNLRTLSRQPATKTLPATTLLGEEWVRVLSGWRYQENRPLTVAEFFLALARLGGHLNRRKDHPPGWLVLWRGWMKLQLMVDGYRAGQRAAPKQGESAHKEDIS